MRARVRTACLLAIAWLGRIDAAHGQVPQQSAADQPGPCPARAHRAPRFHRSRNLPVGAAHHAAGPDRRAQDGQPGQHPRDAEPATRDHPRRPLPPDAGRAGAGRPRGRRHFGRSGRAPRRGGTGGRRRGSRGGAQPTRHHRAAPHRVRRPAAQRFGPQPRDQRHRRYPAGGARRAARRTTAWPASSRWRSSRRSIPTPTPRSS